jgi:hypothetical protein
VRPNVLTQAQRVQGLQENYRLRQAERVAQLKQVQDTIAAEAEDLGGTIFSEQAGDVKKGAVETRFRALESRYGREMATRILMGARAHARSLTLERRKSEFKSDLTAGRERKGEGRRAARAEEVRADKEALPEAAAKQKMAELQLKVLSGEKLTDNEQAFYDLRAKADPLDAVVNRAMRNAIQGLTGETTE